MSPAGPDFLVAPGGRVTLSSNGAYVVGIKVNQQKTVTVTIRVNVPAQPFIPEPELAPAPKPDFEVPDGGILSITKNGEFLISVEAQELTVVVAAEASEP